MASPLEDLDELTLRCRDVRAREYIREAVLSYRAGAFRSAVVATWIAVCFDFMEKLRELALSGDQEADKLVQELDSLRRAGDVSRALKFERQLLDVARDKFELISPIEYIDLSRLLEDRNRCAHPSLTADEQAYAPSAELARLHLHSAVTHLLQHPPVQGKYALDRLMVDIGSDYFPVKKHEAKIALESSPLRRPRESLIRNFILVVVKKLVLESVHGKPFSQLVAALGAVEEMHPAAYPNPMISILSKLFRSVDDENLDRTIRFVLEMPQTWQYLDADVRQRLQHFVTALPAIELFHLPDLLAFEPLQNAARTRMNETTWEEVERTIFHPIHDELGLWMVEKYLKSIEPEDIAGWGKELEVYAIYFPASAVRFLLKNAARYSLVASSIQLQLLTVKLEKSKRIPQDEFDSLVAEHGLLEYLL